MLSNLTERLASVVKTLRGQARITEANSAEMLREIRIALLEADVGVAVIKDFLARVKEEASGQAVLDSLTPGQMLVGIVHRELARLMGNDQPAEQRSLNLAVKPPAIILMAGLQGAGKTTTTGKLARYLKAQKKKVLLVSVDVYRPAAIAQLTRLAEQVGVDMLPVSDERNPLILAQQALDYARVHFHDVILIDSAGRLAIDAAMMAEIKAISDLVQPTDTLFVLDAMMGQDAVNTARAFHQTLQLSGVVVTKMDSDARGGAALSAYGTIGCPIKFVGVSEKMDGLQAFDPDRMARRILGMGDMLALFEEVQQNVDIASAQKLTEKLKSGKGFDLSDFRTQLAQMDGGMSKLLDKLPAAMQKAAQGANAKQLADAEKSIPRMRGIIDAMTPQERQKPDLIKASRKRRIASGAGVQVQEVNKMLTQFDSMQSMMKKMKGAGMMRQLKSMMGKGF